MSKKTVITILGAIVIVLPFLGFPSSLSTPIFVLVGLGIIFIARSATKKRPVNAQPQTN